MEHRFVLLVKQQAMQIHQRPFPLFAPLEQWAVDGVVVTQFIHQIGGFLRCQVKCRHRQYRFGHSHGSLHKRCFSEDHDTIVNVRCRTRKDNV